MGETNFEFLLDFDAAAEAKSMEQQLDKLSKEHRGELAPMMQALLGADYVGEEEINIETIQREKSSIYLFGYGGRSTQPPFDLAASFHELGCKHAYLQVYYDEGGQAQYFIGRKRVSLDAFTAAMRGDRDKGALKNLFLPKDRTQVDATLKEHEWDSNAYGDLCVMRFETKDGHSFYYRGNSEKLLLLAQDEYSPEVTFTAAFEAGYLDPDSPPVSLAKRPTKISVEELSARKSGLSVLRGDNRKFAAEDIGLLVQKYFDEYDCDCNAFLKTLTGDSFLGTSFTRLLKYARNTREYSFLAFGLYVSIDTEPVRLEIDIEDPETKIDAPGLIGHLNSLDVDFFACQKDGAYFCADWATTNAYIECAVSKRRIRLKLARRLKIRDGKRSVKEIHKHFNDNPGMASKADWFDLYERAREGAEAGDTDAMTVFAFLLDTSIRGWEHQPEEARRWRDKAGEAGDSAAMVTAGLRLNASRDPNPEVVNEAMGYFRRAAAMGEERAWDEISDLLLRCPEMVESITLDPPPNTEFDCSAWQVDDKDWMRERRVSWKELEIVLKPQSRVKDLARLKKYYLTGELPVVEGCYSDKPSMFNMSLFDLLWLHPSEDYDELMALRQQVFAQQQFGRRVFHDWQEQFQRRLINMPLIYHENWGMNRDPLVIQNAPMYFRIINNNYTEHGFRRHGEFIKLRPPTDRLRDWMDLAIWFWVPELHEANLAFALLDPDALEWWYSLMPNNQDFSEERNAKMLPYLFLTFYRMTRFHERGIKCPVREEFSARIQQLLNKQPFCEEIGRLWAYVRDTDFTLKDPWADRYESKKEWKQHKDKY